MNAHVTCHVAARIAATSSRTGTNRRVSVLMFTRLLYRGKRIDPDNTASGRAVQVTRVTLSMFADAEVTALRGPTACPGGRVAGDGGVSVERRGRVAVGC